MPSPEQTEMLTYVAALIEATRAGNIEWGRPNPSTFIWDARHDRGIGRVTLQQVERRVRGADRVVRTERSYVFQVGDAQAGGTPKLSAQSSDDREIHRMLDELYNTINSGVTRKGLDFFRSIIPKG